MANIRLLYRLQELDTQIDRFQTRIAEITHTITGDERLINAETEKVNAQKLLQKAQSEQKKSEIAVNDQQIKINQAEAALYGGAVKNPKELQDLQRDIASLKKHLAVLEDTQLEKMLATEEAQEQLTLSEKHYLDIQAKVLSEHAGLAGERSTLEREKQVLQAERDATVSSVTPDILMEYDRLRKNKRGVAVTGVVKSADGEINCSVCGAGLRPSEVQTARMSAELNYCGSCGRILYAG